MKTVTIHFAGGPPCVIDIPAEAIDGLFKQLAIDHDGKTLIHDNGTPTRLINRAQITFVEVA